MTIAAFVAISICSDNSFTYAEEPYSWVWYTDSEAITSIEQYIEKNDTDDEMHRETETEKAYDDLMNSFTIAEDGSCDYPDNFGGTYFDDEGNLVILSTDLDSKVYERAYKGYSGVIFEQVKYSINELDDIIDDILSNYEYPFYYAYVDDEKNEAVIFTSEETYNNEELALSLKDMPVRFEIGAPIVPNTIVYGGSAIRVGSANFTSGAVATNVADSSNVKKLLVTAGHYVSLKDKCYPIKGTRPDTDTLLGTVTKVQYADGKYGDYSLITLGSDIEITTNTYERPYELTPLVGGYYPKDGDTLYKFGRAGNVAKITFQEANMSVVMPASSSGSSTITIKGMMIGKIEDGISTGGDSGGPVYYNSSEGLKLVGFVSGTTSTGTNVYLTFTPVSRVTGCGINYVD